MKILYDVYPAKALVTPPKRDFDTYEFSTMHLMTEIRDSRRVNDVRVVITDEVVMIAAESFTGPVLIFQEKYNSEDIVLSKNKKDISRVRTLSGKSIVFSHDEASCGCGGRLRGWNPYRIVHSTKDPTE
jgi:hypothetical protein